MSKPNAATVKPFASARAAKMAMSKAEKAYSAALNARNVAKCGPWTEAREAAVNAAEAEVQAAAAMGRAVYAQARAQGFWVDSWHFADVNPTRDLITANID
jgi:hypothetical protein